LLYERLSSGSSADIEPMPHSRFDPPCGLGVSRASELTAWLDTARAGDRVVYHKGCLALDRGSTSSLPRRERRRIDDLAAVAHAAAAAGRIHLVQERLATGTFRYLAVRALQESGRQVPRVTGLLCERRKMRARQ
jgi:hypothetical protein